MTAKIIFYFSLFLLLMNSVFAISISDSEITKINHGDISYYFNPDTNISNVELSSTGISIDGDKLITIIQGGELEITFTSWSEEQENMVVSSSVPQTITYKYIINGDKYYVQSNNSIYVDTYKIGDEELNISLIKADITSNEAIIVYDQEDLVWAKRNAFFVVFDDETVVFVKNSQIMTFLVFILIIFGLYLLWRKLR